MIENAVIELSVFPFVEGGPIIDQVLSGADGKFNLPTPEFAGSATFGVHVSKDGFSESLYQVDLLALGCWTIPDSFLQPVQTPVFVDKTVSTDLLGAVVATSVTVVQITVVAGLTGIDNSVAALLELACRATAIAGIGVAVVALLLRVEELVPADLLGAKALTFVIQQGDYAPARARQTVALVLQHGKKVWSGRKTGLLSSQRKKSPPTDVLAISL